MKLISCMVLLGLLLAGPAAGHGPGHPGQYDTALLAPTLPQAFELAAAESKLVCLYAAEYPGKTCRFLHWRSEADDPLFDLIVQQCVIVECNRREHAAALAPYTDGPLPALLLIAPDGGEVRRFTGDLSSRRLLRELTEDFASDETLARDRAAQQQRGRDHLFTRDRMARTLARRGEYAEALEHFRYVARLCITEPDLAARARRPAVFAAIAEAAANHPPARVMLEELRTRTEDLLLNGNDNADLAHDLAHLNAILGEQARSLALYDRLPSDGRAKIGMHEHVFDELLRLQRYTDALAYIDPLVVFRGELALAQRRAITRLAPADAARGRGSRHFALTRGAALLEALAGEGRGNEARQLIDTILEFDARPETVRLMEDHLLRAGNTELTTYLAETGRARK